MTEFMHLKAIARSVVVMAVSALFWWSAFSIYTQLGYNGLSADFSLLKYLLGVDRSGGVLQENIAYYRDDRLLTVLLASVLGGIATGLDVWAMHIWRSRNGWKLGEQDES